jgi:hypothetical protein
MTTNIPLRNIAGEIVDYAQVDAEDFNRVMLYKWHKYSDKYVRGNVHGKDTHLHEFILGEAKEGFVIDHIDGCGLNNTRENLRFATVAQNNQNKPKKQGTTSKYIGVSWHPEAKKWVCWSSTTYLGSFDLEEDAARKYDTWVLLKYGEQAKTNQLVEYDSIKDIDASTLLCKREDRVLPQYIYNKRDGFEVFITFQKKKYRSCHKTLEEAELKLNQVLLQIEEIKQFQEQEHMQSNIQRDSKGVAIVPAKDGDVTLYVQVSDDKWHECMKHKWYKHRNCFQTTIKGTKNKTIMHRFLMNAKEDEIIDHIDGNYLNNRSDNLRLITKSGIIHKRKNKSNTTSKYNGVSFDNNANKWRGEIRKDRKRYSLGLYDNEDDAASAYNSKAIELYGEFAKLNVI